MRLVATVAIHVTGSLMQRQPTLWEKLKKGLGGQINLETDEVKVELEATAVVDQVRKGLARLGVHNALALVIDNTVIFQDSDGKTDDLPDLVIALSEHASVFGRGFKELRFAAEHEETGLHFVIETRARTQHKATEPAAIVSVGGRVKALEPRPSEDAESYRARVEPLTKDPTAFEAARLQFESFVSRLEDALRAAMPEARVEQVRAEARLVKPTARVPAERPEQQRDPIQRGYDPYLAYYPSPMGMMLDVMILSTLMHSFHPSPNIFVTNPAGAPLGTTQEVATDPQRLEADSASDADHGDTGEPGDQGDHGDADADHGGFDDGGDMGGGDMGGDFGGGDFDV
jgi:hypothetical protein